MPDSIFYQFLGLFGGKNRVAYVSYDADVESNYGYSGVKERNDFNPLEPPIKVRLKF